jgi:hypothetical protein
MKVTVCTGFNRTTHKEIFETVNLTIAQARGMIEASLQKLDYEQAAAWVAACRKENRKLKSK